MEQVLQNVRTGSRSVVVAPDPIARPGHVLIANACSLISAGTEKMIMDLAKKSLLAKARERPDHVRRVVQKIRTEGLAETFRQVREKLDEPMALGYSSAGTVLACGAGCDEFKPGQRVASNGPHASLVCVPKHLCAKVPDGVTFDQASFAVVGAIALQGARLSRATLGETVLVIGLGLVGQLTLTLLRSAGCRVLGTDPDAAKCALALRMGAEAARPKLGAGDVESLTRSLGADAVIITASTKSNGPIDLAARAVRQKGRVVLVGVVGLELDRRPFYFKEAEFVVSCSYGPGRYDPDYEQHGRDYPAAYVRWTEQRNIQAVLDLLGRKGIDVSPLISHRFSIAEAESAYQLIEKGGEPYLGIVLEYPRIEARAVVPRVQLHSAQRIEGQIGIGAIGAGNFACMVLLPAIRKHPQLRLVAICSAGGVSAVHAGAKLGFETAIADEDALFADPQVQAIFAITRHDQHAAEVIKAIRTGKPIFVEKPLCLTLEELDEIEEALAACPQPPLVMVGFNRRFSRAAEQVKQFFAPVDAPLTIAFRFNAGAIPPEHWSQSDETGGGRIVGEACHAIDLATFLAGSPPVRIYAESVGGPHAPAVTDDQCFITLRHANGSISSVAYLAGGDRGMPKERIEVLGGGRMAVIDDFRQVITAAGGVSKKCRIRGRDMGHAAEIDAFVRAISSGGPAPIAWSDLRAVSRTAILAVRSLREGVPIEIG